MWAAPREVLVLLGHAGLTASSPTDCRGLSEEGRRRHIPSWSSGKTRAAEPARWAVLCAEQALSKFSMMRWCACATKLMIAKNYIRYYLRLQRSTSGPDVLERQLALLRRGLAKLAADLARRRGRLVRRKGLGPDGA